MHQKILSFSLVAALFLGSCSVQLASIADKTPEQVQAAYKVTKDVAYGTDQEQVMDIYLSPAASKLKNKNYTIVFLHGGGYYISDKSREERYIQPYLKRLERGEYELPHQTRNSSCYGGFNVCPELFEGQ